MSDDPIDQEPGPEPDEDAQPRRRAGDDPFLPEEGYFWWLPRVAAIALVTICVVLLTVATVHHGKYRLQRLEDGTVQLERGRFAPRGWGSYVPDGAVGAWSPVPWPHQAPDPPLRGELRDLSDTWLGMLRAHAEEVREDDGALGALAGQEDGFEAWYRGRWSEEPATEGSVEQLRREQERLVADAAAAREQQQREEDEAAARAAAAEELARAQHAVVDPEGAQADELSRARDYSADRRGLLGTAEQLLARLPPDGSPEQERDRAAIEAFIAAMDTPAALALPAPPAQQDIEPQEP